MVEAASHLVYFSGNHFCWRLKEEKVEGVWRDFLYSRHLPVQMRRSHIFQMCVNSYVVAIKLSSYSRTKHHGEHLAVQ